MKYPKDYKHQMFLDHIICVATNPTNSSLDYHSRGRCHHLVEPNLNRFNFPATKCGMRVVEFGYQLIANNLICIQCQQIIEKELKISHGGKA